MDRVKSLASRHCIYLLSFMAAPLILLLVFALRGVYPFGQNSVLALDLNGQYVYYYEYYRGIFLADNSLFYSFSRSLGGEMIGTFAYYLASPFSLILLLFPKGLITEAVLAMILLKVGAAALTFAIYLTVILFSTMYGLMSYNIIQTMNPMWLDGPIFFPLIILAVERLVDLNRWPLYVFFLSLLFMANFYIGYMVGIFVMVYFFYYLYLSKKCDNWRAGFKKIVSFITATLFAIAGSLWLLLPTYNALRFGKFGFTNPSFTPLQKLDIFDLLAKMLPLSYDSVNVQGQPFVYSGLLALVLLISFFSAKMIDNRKKFAAATLLSVVFVILSVSTLDLVLHGFQEPIWLNFRYSFVLTFFVLLIGHEAYSALVSADQKMIFRTGLVLMVVIAFLGRFAGDWLKPEKTIWLSYILVILYCWLLYSIKTDQDRPPAIPEKLALPAASGQKMLEVLLLFVVFLELFLNTIALIDSAHKEVYFSDRATYRDYFDRLSPAIDYLVEEDRDFYRTETVMRRTVNDPMALGIHGVSHSSSVLNQSVIDLMYQLGFAAREHWTSYKGATPVSDALLGVRYIIAEKPVNSLYSETYKGDEVRVYKNHYALPIAYAVDQKIQAIELDSHDPFANQNFLLSSMIGEPYTEFFKLLSIGEILFENIEGVEQDGIVVYTILNPAQNAHIEYLIETAEGNEMYMYLVSSIPRKVNIWKDHEYVDTFFDYGTVYIVPLGSNPGSASISLITTPIEGEYYLNHNLFYYLDRPVFEEAMARLGRNKVQVERISDTKLRIEAEIDEGEILFTSIPYDEGWQVRVDGEKTKIVKTLDSLLAVELLPGKRVITLDYCPRGLKEGLIISAIAWLLFIVLVAYERFSGRKYRY